MRSCKTRIAVESFAPWARLIVLVAITAVSYLT